MYWLTGWQKFHLMREVSEGLPGRVAVIDMLGLSLAEIVGQPTPRNRSCRRPSGSPTPKPMLAMRRLGQFPTSTA